jgi:hypothetical protein
MATCDRRYLRLWLFHVFGVEGFEQLIWYANERVSAEDRCRSDCRGIFQIAKDDVYGKAKPNVPVIHKFVDVTPKECANEAPASILHVRVDGDTSYDNDATHSVVRLQLFKAGVRLGRHFEPTVCLTREHGIRM